MFPGNRVRKAAVLDHADTSKRVRSKRRGCNQRLHLNIATLVTPTVRFPVPNYLMTNNER
jgi:hypothetical protein